MSLAGKVILDRVRIRVDATDREYIAESVVATRELVGKRRRMADKSNRIFTEGYHVLFEIAGQDIEQVSGSARGVKALQTDLEAEENILFFPDADESKSFAVIAGPNVSELLETEFGARVDGERITMITKELLSKTDIEWFEK